MEPFEGVSGILDGLDVLPDCNLLPPFELNCVEKDGAARIKKAFKGVRHQIIGRVANNSVALPEQNRTVCIHRNKCGLGCPLGAYLSHQSSTFPAAMATGNLPVRPFSIV